MKSAQTWAVGIMLLGWATSCGTASSEAGDANTDASDAVADTSDSSDATSDAFEDAGELDGSEPDGDSTEQDGSVPTDGGTPDAGDTDGSSGPDCGGLTFEPCEATPGCRAFSGWPSAAYCANDHGTKVFVQCEVMGEEVICGDAETCGQAPDGSRLFFPTTCLPQGWSECTSDPCAQDPCVGLDQEACAASPSCIPLLGHSLSYWCNQPAFAEPPDVYAGCVHETSEPVCTDAPLCAEDPATGQRAFFVTCAPPTWGPCPPDPCATSPCEGFTKEQCAQARACMWFWAYDGTLSCSGGEAEPPSTVDVGCGPVPGGCDDALTCGVDPASATTVMFPNSCLAPGWQPCAGDPCAMAQCLGLGGTVPPGYTFCLRGTSQPDGSELIEAGDAVKLQIHPDGCWSSSCTEWPIEQCVFSAGADGNITASGVACAIADTSGPCTPDCGGSFAICSGKGLHTAGNHVLEIGGAQLSFAVPATLPAGGLCLSVLAAP